MKTLLLSSILALFPNWAWACSVCMGAMDKRNADAIGNGILFLIGVTVVVLIALTFFVVRLIKASETRS